MRVFCVEKREGIFYGCSSSTSGRRLLILNALSGGPTFKEILDPLQVGPELGDENEDIFCVCTSSTSDGRFLTGAEQGPRMNQGDGILELSWSVLW